MGDIIDFEKKRAERRSQSLAETMLEAHALEKAIDECPIKSFEDVIRPLFHNPIEVMRELEE